MHAIVALSMAIVICNIKSRQCAAKFVKSRLLADYLDQTVSNGVNSTSTLVRAGWSTIVELHYNIIQNIFLS